MGEFKLQETINVSTDVLPRPRHATQRAVMP